MSTSVAPSGARWSPRALLRGAVAVAGLGVIAAVFWRIGWPGIRENLLSIGPWFLGLVALNLVAQAAFVAGLRNVLEPGGPRVSFARLYEVYAMGDAANYVAPASGEALKTHLLSDAVGGEAAMAAVTLHKHADLAAQCTLAVVGTSVALWRFPLPRAVALAAILGSLALVVLLLLMTWALGRGAFSPILRHLGRWKFLARHVEKLHPGAQAVDTRIRRFHEVHPRRFLGAAAFCFLGWFGAVVETWIVLVLLVPKAGWPSALAIESLAMVLNNALLFVPGKAGGAEGVRTGVVVVVGLTAAQGAAYALVRRSRELLWILPGWLLILYARSRHRRVAVPSDDSVRDAEKV